MNLAEAIPALLSNHRQLQEASQPLTLARQQILSLLNHAAPPNGNFAAWQESAANALEELQAQGEIVAGMGKRYCVAPPTVLALSKNDLQSLRFQGDRAYLSLAHQVLKTGQPQHEILLHPQISGFNRIRDVLEKVGVRFSEVSDSIQGLPLPCKPAVWRSPLEENPFVTYIEIEQYTPQSLKNQAERWRSIYSDQKLTPESLLRLPTGEYCWFHNGKFYELEPESSVLAMFAQDAAAGHPLTIEWDEVPGRVNLQGIILPSTYARWLWRLSDPDPDHYRTRLVPTVHRPVAKNALTRLGCELV